MPKRVNKIRHDEQTRAKIQAAQIINRLYGHVMGEVDLDSAQVSSAKALLNKVLPDLAAHSIQGSGDDGAILVQQITRKIVEPDNGA